MRKLGVLLVICSYELHSVATTPSRGSEITQLTPKNASLDTYAGYEINSSNDTDTEYRIYSKDNDGLHSNTTELVEEGRKKKNKQQADLMSRILPMMIVPFMIQTAMIPMVLTSLKFMLLKSMVVGKLAILLVALNALRRSMNGGAVYSHNVNIQPEMSHQLSQAHYGYSPGWTGGVEYGAYVNR